MIWIFASQYAKNHVMARLEIASAGDRRCQKCRNRTSMALNHNVNYIFWDFLEWHDPLNQNYVRFIPDQILKLKWTPTARWKKHAERESIFLLSLNGFLHSLTHAYVISCGFPVMLLTTLRWRLYDEDSFLMLMTQSLCCLPFQCEKSVTNILNRSQSSQWCYQQPSPLPVTNIDVAILILKSLTDD